MKLIKTRKGFFETNSSSTHSVSIIDLEKDDILDSLPVIEKGVVRISTGEFGWEYETYNDAETKASYCLQWIICEFVSWDIRGTLSDTEPKIIEFDELYKFLDKLLVTDEGAKYLSLLKKTILNQTKADNIIVYLRDGYIDHSSDKDFMREKVLVSEESLKSFIFNPLSELETGNDNE